MIDIIMPTCKTRQEVDTVINEIKNNTPERHRLIVTCQNVSAAINRNYGLSIANSDIIVMVDDDMTGFFEGWLSFLIEPLQHREVVMVSARLMGNKNRAGEIDVTRPGVMIGCQYNLGPDVVEVLNKELPTACCAIRKDDIRFHEGFIGSGFEDNHFCWQLNRKYGNIRYVITNKVKLVHLNERKNQEGEYWIRNRALFLQLTGRRR